MRYLARLCICMGCICMVGAPLVSNAHLLGASYEEEKDGYLIDIGYSPEDIVAGERMRFDFLLYQEVDRSWERVETTDVWVRITRDERVYFAGGINNPRFGAPGFLFVFPEAGLYEISARYQNDDARIVDTTFSILVTAGDRPDDEPFVKGISSTWMIFYIGIMIGLVSSIIIIFGYRYVRLKWKGA